VEKVAQQFRLLCHFSLHELYELIFEIGSRDQEAKSSYVPNDARGSLRLMRKSPARRAGDFQLAPVA
jgi:hypothetical protein